ncbi:MAG: AAA family ATPase [Aestuariivita sp.]|nr:AAA family ATPase [Aestuariivita sp.]
MTIENECRIVPQSRAGARFYRCALQVNPSDYTETFCGQALHENENEYAQKIIDKAVNLGIEVLAITDHNSVKGVAAFRSAANERPVHIFPGFEIASSEGVHLLCLYSMSVEDKQLERYLGDLGILNTKPSSDLSTKSLREILTTVRDQGGLVIAAHATNQNGLFRKLSGQSRIRAWQDPNLLAIQIPGLVEDLPQNILSILKNQDSTHRRDPILDHGLAIAVVNACDVTTSDDLVNPSATCWIKMQEISLDGLRQAFLDPGSRVRLNPKQGNFALDHHVEIMSISWEGGFLDGITLPLNPNLNVLIGGRGVGKSTIVESIRYALGLDPLGEEAKKIHDGIVGKVLCNGTKISLLIQIQKPNSRQYRIERTLPNPPVVWEKDGEVLPHAPIDILPNVEVYGQHEMSELAREPYKRTRLLDLFVTQDDHLARQKASLKRSLKKNRQNLGSTQEEIDSMEERLANLPSLEAKLEQFCESGAEERLHEQSILVREERVLESISHRLTPFQEILELLQKELPIDLAFLSKRALEELPNRSILSQANETLSEVEMKMLPLVENMKDILHRAEGKIDTVRGQWKERQQQVQTQYE